MRLSIFKSNIFIVLGSITFCSINLYAQKNSLSNSNKSAQKIVEQALNELGGSDDSRNVELINVDANPHTAENIVVYLPKEKILFQGDLFYFNGETTFPPRSEIIVMPFFAKWLKENNLKPDRIYGLHSRGFATMKHIEQIFKDI